MIVAGLQKLTLLDYPGKTACTVFTYGCNFQCPFCHNGEIIIDDIKNIIQEQAIFDFLYSRKGLIDGVCITGGEPTLQPDLEIFIQTLKEMGFLVKLDTNGYCPNKLSDLIDKKLIDMVAMDIKNCLDKYEVTTGTHNLDLTKIQKSVDIIMNSGVDYEFRTTVLDGFHTDGDFEKIGQWIENCDNYFLQKFKKTSNIIDNRVSGATNEQMKHYLDIVRKYIPNSHLRGCLE